MSGPPASLHLLDLPHEILLQILELVYHGPPSTYHRPSPSERRNFSSLLRANRLLHSLALPIFHRHVTIGLPGLCKLPAATPLADTHRDNTNSKSPLAEYMRSLAIELDYFSAPINSFAVSPSLTTNVTFEVWFEQLNTRLTAFSGRWPLYTRLTHLSIRAQQLTRTTDVFTRARRATRPFLDESTLLQCFSAVARCERLEVLELDTADADTSRWSLDTGVGPACAVHVCEALRMAVEGLAQLRKLFVRRRDMCPRVVAFGADSEVLRSGKLEEVIVDLRIAETQRTGLETWEAHARHCGCCCWCTKCLKRWHEGNAKRKASVGEIGQEDEAMHAGHQRVEDGGMSLVDMMIGGLRQVAGSMSADKGRKVELRAYDAPSKEVFGRARKPVVIDCVTGKRTEACGVL